MNPLLTYAEAAAMLSVSRATLYRMIEAGTLTPVRPSPGTPRIRLSDVEAIMAGNTTA